MMSYKYNKFFLVLGIIIFSLFFVSCSSDESKQQGIFWDLNEAYILSKLNQEELQEIANYHHNNLESLEPLNKIAEEKIKNTRLLEIKPYYTNAVPNDISIIKYYGLYKECYVVMLSDKFSDYLNVEHTENIAGIDFQYSTNNKILVWSEKSVDVDDKIKCEYIKTYLLKEYPYANINDVFIEKRYGIYNNAHVLILTNNYEEYNSIITKESILNYVFEYSNHNSALLYYNEKFYTLKEAYRSKILSLDDLKRIFEQFPTPSGEGREINGEPIIEEE